MPILPLPISFGSNEAIEETSLTTHGAKAVDVYLDPNGNIIRRPALTEFADTGVSYAVDGLYWWDRQSKVIAVTGGRIFEITDSSGTTAEISGDNFELNNIVSWSDFGTSLYGANGGKIVKIPSSGNAAYVSDASAPTTVYKIADIDDYLLALEDGTERVHYSYSGDPDTWPGNWISAVSNPDLLKTIGTAGDAIELLGAKILEGWRNDGVTPFVKEDQFTIRRGISAPDSFIFIEDTWYWIDQEKKVMRLNGRQPEILSLSLNKLLRGFDVVSDAVGGQTLFDGRPQYILQFPTEGRTIIVDVYSKAWSDLGRWDSVGARYQRFLGRSFCSATDWGLQLVGDRLTGKIYKLDSVGYQDNGANMRPLIRTPEIDREQPSLFKKVSRLDLYFKKLESATASDTASVLVRWRNNGETEWRGRRSISLGRVGKTAFYGATTRLGRYKTRQYEFILEHNAPIAFVRADETFSIRGMKE